MMYGTKAPPQKPKGKDYGYGNARIRGMKSHLLDSSFYERLMACEDLSNMITVLTETEYRVDLESELLHGHTAGQVEEALKENMARTFRKVLAFLEDEAAYLMTTLLGRWDLFNLKTIIRGRHLQMSSAEIVLNLMPVGQLGEVELEALAQAPDVRAVVDTMATWGLPYAEPLTRVLGDYLRESDISVLELALDRHHAEWAMARLSRRGVNFRMAREIMTLQVDTTNLMTAMRLQKADLEEEDIAIERFFLHGGTYVPEQLFLDLARLSDIDEFLDRVKGTMFGKALEEAAVRYVEIGSIVVFERALEDFVMRKALSTGVGDPLGVGVVISYLWAKHNEVINLRIIVKGQDVGMPIDRVRTELILV